MIWATRPSVLVMAAGSEVRAMGGPYFLAARRGGHRFGGRRNLGDLVGNSGLANLVVRQGQTRDEVVGIISGGSHGDHLRAEERRSRFEDCLVNQHLDVTRQKLLED